MESEQAEQAKEYSDPSPAPLLDKHECRQWSCYRAIVAEFIATLLFVYIGISAIIGNHKNNGAELQGVGLLGVSWSFGAIVFVLVYCTTRISGGHLNPAVTFAFFLARKLSLWRAGMYIFAQCLGAICGAALVKCFQHHAYVSGGGGANLVQEGYAKIAALAAEMVGTFIVVYTVFSAADRRGNVRRCHLPVLDPLPIGFAVFAVHLATIPITGTGINPARSFGAAVVYSRKHTWKQLWIFWLGPLMGATAAVAAACHGHFLRAARMKYSAPLTGSSQSAPV